MSEPKVFYERRGRRYYPVSYYDSEVMDAMPEGAHLVIVSPVGRFVRYRIDPDYAALIAAGKVAEDAMVKAIQATSEIRQGRTAIRPNTDREKKAFEAYKQISGSGWLLLESASAQEIAAAGVKALIEAAKGQTS